MSEIAGGYQGAGAGGEDAAHPIRICLAGSGGGHVRQLLDLEPVYAGYDHFFVTEPTALGASLREKSRVHFVEHVALGQARFGAPIAMIGCAIRNFWQSLKIIMRERPDAVITTGAGAMFFTVVLARLWGAHVIMIDSFARFRGPSTFARLVSPFAHRRVVQSLQMANAFADAKVFDPLKVLDRPRPRKKAKMFVTVGATLPFDRMVNMVAAAKESGAIPEEVLAQVGVGGARPAGLDIVETLPFAQMHAMLEESDLVVCHGGTGSLITALQHGCRVIVVPRRFDLKEHYDNHQEEISTALQERGLVEVVRDEADFLTALAAVRAREPVSATSDPSALRAYLISCLADLAEPVAAEVSPA
ncbi:MAG: glycosyltransferase [Sphingobium sp.]